MRTSVRALTLTATLAASLAVASCSQGGDHDDMDGMSGMGGASSSSTASGSTSAAAGDVMFAQMMVPHHQQAVEMADLALTKAESPEVKSLATKIKAAQGPEIETMNGWLQQWGAPTTAGGMDHGTDGMMTDADMSRLRDASGAQFDRLWLTMMVAHHEGALTMAKDVLATTRDSRVRTLAQDVVDGQTREISTMKAMLSAS